ncbi:MULTISPECIES: hydantoinase B/oxoprolinase family protein [unclassified Bradyrhizobium]|uniref:hydantoinase B/oxoprolinase family protein n=1 Tax=unclassified Bradyrhizobium TaxID=2631580 RepID=UPI00247A9E6D|nr:MULTISPECIES: hydantoinase B/oxoprolinase family protein [unclassified Bradyrhizobium]WGS19188.1 hydantoinase B/oxoprolinase family protein [Bradyrhizobium sp. ISRA463]WGS26023.1 hydantoinase B/oxoprolinase family protein [Bradyrhizobium sp. ISRA464]
MSAIGNAKTSPAFDPVLTSVMANRLDGIIREMSNTMLRTARSAVINMARDFSCAITTGDNQLLSSAEGLPVHIFGSHLQSAAMTALHKDLAKGDAFLHNDPYLGNTHPADHTILVPVFFEGEHLFTACAKAHQADIGNSIPTTYHAAAKDVYEEGSLIFPCVRVQRNYQTIGDIVRMCRSRIRVAEQWHGDFLAGIGSARIGERRLMDFCAKYGKETVKAFIRTWLDYSEERMTQAVRKLPRARLVNEGRYDPFLPLLPEGIPLKVVVDINPDAGVIELDLRDNIDCVDCGLNQSEACTINNALTGVFNCIESDIPHNSGSFRRLKLLLRENCVVGIPQFPHSCSVATTNVGDRLVNITQSAFAQLGDGYGLSEGGESGGAGCAVVSGTDYRHANSAYINQLCIGSNGGPANPKCDGWVTYGFPVVGGLMYRDSVEIDELKHPIQFDELRLVPGTGGAGRFRGAPGAEVVYGPRNSEMTVAATSDGQENPPRGMQGGWDGRPAAMFHVSAEGGETKLPSVIKLVLKPGEKIRSVDNGGGGYGNPLERDPKRVLHDILENWETMERAYDVYGVVLTGSAADESLVVDMVATHARRVELAAIRNI